MAAPPERDWPSYEKSGHLHKLGYVNKSWKERIFAINVSKKQLLYFKTEDEFKAHASTAVANQTGTINLVNSILYFADYMDRRFCIELAVRDDKNVTTRHYFLYAETGQDLREWMVLLVEGGAQPAGPVFPMRVALDAHRTPKDRAAFVGADASTIPAAQPKSYSSVNDDGANPLIAPFDFPVTLAKFGFLQKRGSWNTSYKTRFCRTETDAKGQPVLAYYSTVETSSVNGTIPLTSIKIDDDKAAADELSFKLTSAGSNRTYNLRAPSKGQKKQWIAILTRISAGERMATESVKGSGQAAAAVVPASSSSSSFTPAKTPAEHVASVSAAKVAEALNPTPTPATPAPASTSTAAAPPSEEVRIGADGQQYRKRKVKRGSILQPDAEDGPVGGKTNGTVASSAASPAVASSSSAVTATPATVAPVVAPTPSPSPPSASVGASSMSPATTFQDSPPAGVMSPSGTTTAATTGGGHVRQHSHTPSSRRESTHTTAAVSAALEAAAPVPTAVKPSDVEFKMPDEDAMLKHQNEEDVVNAFARTQQGCDMWKIPTSSFSSPERKRFYLLSVTKSAKAQSLLEEARKEIKQKSKEKLPYYESIKSGYLLHWDSTKAYTYESFIWLNPAAPKSEWSLFWGQEHGMFTKKKLKENLSSLASQSFTIETPKRSFDLVVENRADFQQWKIALTQIDSQR